MKYTLDVLAMLGGGILGFCGLYFGYKLSQTKYGRGKTETMQTIFTKNTFK